MFEVIMTDARLIVKLLTNLLETGGSALRSLVVPEMFRPATRLSSQPVYNVYKEVSMLVGTKLPTLEDDPVLQMWGVGKEIWADERGDEFIRKERASLDKEMDQPLPTTSA
jgi:hypothetical protein